MRNISKQELDKIIDNHKLWLQSDGEKGERAALLLDYARKGRTALLDAMIWFEKALELYEKK